MIHHDTQQQRATAGSRIPAVITGRLPAAAAVIALAILMASAREAPAPPPPPERIHRIVSLSPSITRQLVDLGAGGLVAGITGYDTTLGRNVPVVGSLIQPDMEAIIALQPDIILLSEEDNSTQITERINATGIPAHTFSRNANFNAIGNNFIELGRLVGREALAAEKLAAYRRRLASIAKPAMRPRVALFVSHNPLIAAAGASFVGAIIEAAGGENIFGAFDIPYPIVSAEYLVTLNPDIIISIIPAPDRYFIETLRKFTHITAIRRGAVYHIDPDMIGLYSPDMFLKSTELIRSMLHNAD